MLKRVLVCGGRTYGNIVAKTTDHSDYSAAAEKAVGERLKLFKTLDEYAAAHGPIILIQGGADGTDKWAREWSKRQKPEQLYMMVNVPADWKAHGRAAGPIRNQRMLDEQCPDVVFEFPGGTGTADMVRRAKLAGVPVVTIDGSFDA